MAVVDLDSIGLRPRTSGRAAKPVEATLGRPLTPADIALLETERGIKAPSIVRLRDSHHALAQDLALGMTPGEASQTTGYSLSRISILQQDPAFQELLAFYRTAKGDFVANVQERLRLLSLDAMHIMHERLLENPDEIAYKELNELIKASLDRSGHGPASRSTTVNVNADLASMMEAARKRAGMQPDPKVSPPLLEGRVVEEPVVE